MVTEAKEKDLESLRELFKKSNCAVIADYRGVSAEGMTLLRKDVREAGGKLRVVKNTLARIAVKDTGFEASTSMLSGPVSIAFSFGEDVSGPAKVVLDFAKKNKEMEIIGGVLEGSALDKEGVKSLASMPQKPVLQAMLLGLLQAPARNFIGVLAGAPRKFLYACNAIAEKKQES